MSSAPLNTERVQLSDGSDQLPAFGQLGAEVQSYPFVRSEFLVKRKNNDGGASDRLDIEVTSSSQPTAIGVGVPPD